MTILTKVHAATLEARKQAMSGAARSLRNHRTLGVGILYVITIVLVLEFTARR